MASFFSRLFGHKTPPPRLKDLEAGSMCQGNSDWLLVIGSQPKDIQAAVEGHAALFDKEVPVHSKVKLSKLAESWYALQFDPLPAYDAVNLINWLGDPSVVDGVQTCYGWFTSPGNGQRYLLFPNPELPEGDTLWGLSEAGQGVEIYLLENRMCEISYPVTSLAEPSLSSLQLLAESTFLAVPPS